MSAPAHTALSVQQFLTQNNMTPMPHPPYSPNLTLSDFILFPWMKKVLKGKHFAHEKEAKQKNSKSTKRPQNQWVQQLLSSGGKKILIGALQQMESTLKVTEVQMCKNKYTIFYK